MKIKRTQKMAPIRVYFPIERVDEKEHIAEGYAFVNEVVEGEGGVRLKRTAMQKATDGYMKWGAVREMHEAKAAGTALQVKWDDKGALLRAKIVDDAAWEKVKAGVYKGFSVGVRAKQMRGLNVEQADWIETSLVDRPADPDAIISLVRAATDAGDEQDVQLLDEEPGDDVKALKKEIKRLQKEVEDLKAAAGQGAPDIQRLQSEKTGLLKRVEGLETDLKESKAQRKAQKKEIKRLLQQPAAIPPVRYPSALQRDFAANEGKEADTELQESLKEFTELKATLASEPDAEKRHKGAIRLNFLKGGLMAAGLDV